MYHLLSQVIINDDGGYSFLATLNTQMLQAMSISPTDQPFMKIDRKMMYTTIFTIVIKMTNCHLMTGFLALSVARNFTKAVLKLVGLMTMMTFYL